MLRNECQSKFLLCKNCINCKRKNGKIFCKEGNFYDINQRELEILTPFDFECVEFKG